MHNFIRVNGKDYNVGEVNDIPCVPIEIDRDHPLVGKTMYWPLVYVNCPLYELEGDFSERDIETLTANPYCFLRPANIEHRAECQHKEKSATDKNSLLINKVGILRRGHTIIFVKDGLTIREKIAEVLDPGTDKELVITNTISKESFYTAEVLEGKSWVEEVRFADK